MNTTFSPQLVTRAQRIIKERSGRVVSADEAILCLERLARIGDLAVRVMKQESRKVKKTQDMRGP